MNVELDLNAFLRCVLGIEDASILDRIVSGCKVIEKTKGDQIIRPEGAAEQVLILVSGIAREYIINEEGKDVSFRFAYTAGDLLTNENIFLNLHSFYWEALAPSEFIAIPTALVDEALSLNPAFRTHVETIRDGLYARESSLRYALLTMHAKERYLWFSDNYPEFPKSIPQKYIASYLNMLPQTLSQVRHDLKNEIV